MTDKRLKQKFRRIVGADAFLDNPAATATYSYDSSLLTARPDFVLFPQTAEQVAQVVTLLFRERIPYLARGAGTNLSGGSIPLKGGAVISLTRMKRILSIEPENFCARVEPGVTNLEFQQALSEHGFFFAPDPASQRVSTIGGNVAENSGGPHCLKYGVTTNHILGLKLVTPDGNIIELGGRALDAAGYDVLGLLVGSEGTLGIATEISCRILQLPPAVRTLLAIYDATEDASQTVSEIIAAGILPATLEMMDNLVIRAVEEALHAGYPTDASAILIIEVDGIAEGLAETVRMIEDICRRNRVREVRVARDEREREQLWAGRRGAFGAVARLFPNYSVSDGTVPRNKLPEVLRQVSEIGKKYALEIGNVFHAGDGNLHPLIFFDVRDPQQTERVHRAGKEILEACVAAGGTISGEHGVGAEKIDAMHLVFGVNEIELMRRLKNALDPAGVCNPRKVLPESSSETIVPPAQSPRHSSEPASDGIPSRRTYLPKNIDEIASLPHYLRQSGKSIAAMGACTLFEYLPKDIQRWKKPHGIICSPLMRSIVEHDAANLTVTAEAWLTLRELQERLAAAGQFLPLDAPSEATLGGIVAAGLSGPRRHLYGSVRDLVLGLQLVTSDGKVLRAGGKTMKNVAGYDFGKLLIGSWGTLGIIVDVTFRLMPLPKASGALIASFQRVEDALEASKRILAGRLNPALLTLMNGHAAAALAMELAFSKPDREWSLILGAEGSDSAVQAQLNGMEQACRACSGDVSARVDVSRYYSLVDIVTRLCYPPAGQQWFLSLWLSMPCGSMSDGLREVEALTGEMTSLIVAHVAGGLICTHLSTAEEVTGGACRCIVDALGARLPQSTITVLKTHTASAESMPFIVGRSAPSSWLKAVKECFDPEGLMNPAISLW
ncbi:MAG: FAD-binding oxidoreductase [Candidatus Abyssobacteria bacterium SURF_17]|uniref:FAD-binding oxidoreductase n=1 Tax=Candidatus Abyssobacteria bacterium SURF_17 TaxID=2093361 RepID=A0A419EVS5_9BACT|nr:MAG: FAD-binding oxidoreductase [Candidatus Abyssubacteria bacterium SURF_17]